jgi:hypothetical protein
MKIAREESFVHQPFESSISEVVPVFLDVVVPHLIHGNPDDKAGLRRAYRGG